MLYTKRLVYFVMVIIMLIKLPMCVILLKYSDELSSAGPAGKPPAMPHEELDPGVLVRDNRRDPKPSTPFNYLA